MCKYKELLQSYMNKGYSPTIIKPDDLPDEFEFENELKITIEFYLIRKWLLDEGGLFIVMTPTSHGDAEFTLRDCWGKFICDLGIYYHEDILGLYFALTGALSHITDE